MARRGQAELQRIRDEATELKAGATTDDFTLEL